MGGDAATINKETTWSFWRGFFPKRKASQTRNKQSRPEQSRAEREKRRDRYGVLFVAVQASWCCAWVSRCVLGCAVLMLTGGTDCRDQDPGPSQTSMRSVCVYVYACNNNSNKEGQRQARPRRRARPGLSCSVLRCFWELVRLGMPCNPNQSHTQTSPVLSRCNEAHFACGPSHSSLVPHAQPACLRQPCPISPRPPCDKEN